MPSLKTSQGGNGSAGIDQGQYAEQTGRLQREALDSEADRAEWDVPDGRVGQMVRQLRRRARVANARAQVLLYGLLCVVLVGIGAYVLWPIVQNYVDGQRKELLRTQEAIEQVGQDVSKQRNGLIETLSERLKISGKSVPASIDGSLSGHLKLQNGGGLIYGYGDTVLRFDAQSALQQIIELDYYVDLTDHLQLETGGWLIYGEDGDVLRFDALGVFQGTPLIDIIGGLYGHLKLQNGGWLIYGEEGTILRFSAAGTLENTIKLDTDADFYHHLQLQNGDWLIYSEGGAILRFDAAGALQETMELNIDGYIFGHLQLQNGGWLIYGYGNTVLRLDAEGALKQTIELDDYTEIEGHLRLEGGGWVLYGKDATVLRFDAEGALRDTIRRDIDADLYDHVQLQNGGWLIYGYGDNIVRLDATGALQQTSEFDYYATLVGHLELQNGGWLIYGFSDNVLRFSAAGMLQEAIAIDIYPDLNGHLQLQDGTWLIYGDEGKAFHFEASGALREAVPTGIDADLDSHLQLQDDTWLIYGNDGAVIKIGDELTTELDKVVKDSKGLSEADIDEALLYFLSVTLDGYRFDEIGRSKSMLAEIIAQRRIVAARLKAINKTLIDLPSGAYFLQTQRETFGQFMETCRGMETPSEEPGRRKGFTDADPDAVTLACTEAWRIQEAGDAGSWWQTLATQVPPGVLLLFLLSTLNGLYRYNLRLAGFHTSRADLLELMAARPDLFERTQGETDMVPFAVYADALAADKVEFGKASTPSDQVVELARAIAARGK